MSGLMKWATAFVTALLLGFGAGEMFGPDRAAAGEPCAYGICYYHDDGEDYWYECQATVNETYCTCSGFEDWMCTTEGCEEPCDPEEPDCHGELESTGS